jgi:hypothetical protein
MAVKLVVAHIEHFEKRKATEYVWRYRATKGIADHREAFQGGNVPNWWRDESIQIVKLEGKLRDAGHAAQRWRNYP